MREGYDLGSGEYIPGLTGGWVMGSANKLLSGWSRLPLSTSIKPTDADKSGGAQFF